MTIGNASSRTPMLAGFFVAWTLRSSMPASPAWPAASATDARPYLPPRYANLPPSRICLTCGVPMFTGREAPRNRSSVPASVSLTTSMQPTTGGRRPSRFRPWPMRPFWRARKILPRPPHIGQAGAKSPLIGRIVGGCPDNPQRCLKTVRYCIFIKPGLKALFGNSYFRACAVAGSAKKRLRSGTDRGITEQSRPEKTRMVTRTRCKETDC